MNMHIFRAAARNSRCWDKMISNEMRKRLVLSLVSATLLSSLASIGHSADWWVGQSATGSASGADTNDLMSIATVNSAFPASPGDTVHICGTISNSLTVAHAGTAGHPITIHFEANAKFSAPTLPPGNDWISPNSFVTIDGGVNGRLELTDNGTPAGYGGTFNHNNGSVWAIFGGNTTGLTIQNLAIAGMYVRQSTNDPGPVNDANEVCGIFTRDASCLTISNCAFSDCEIVLFLTYNSNYQSNVVVTACSMTNYNWGVSEAADSNNGMLDNLTITHNSLVTGDAWEGNPNFHRNSIYLRDDIVSGGRMKNIVIADNYIQGGGSHPLSTSAGTGGCSFSINNYTNAQNVWIFNNVAKLIYPLTYSAGGGVALGANGINVLVANNTVIGWTNAGTGRYGGCGISVAGTNAFCFNNIVIAANAEQVGTIANVTGLTDSFSLVSGLLAGNVLSDFNVFNYQSPNSFVSLVYDTNYVGGFSELWSEHLFDSLSAWRANIPSQDPHSTTAIVQVDADYVPLVTDTVAIARGTNLTEYAQANFLPWLTNDYAGNPRPIRGNWTIGAYQNGSTNGPLLSGNGNGNVNPFGNYSGVPGPDITNGMMLQYKFNQGLGSSAIDSSGNGNTGVLRGNAGWTNGMNVAGTAVSFPSNDGLFSSYQGVGSSMTYTGDWTITFWAYNNSFPGLYNYAASIAAYSGILVNYNNEITAWGFCDGTYYLNGLTALNAQQWYFLSVSKSNGTNYQLYLNGNKDSFGTLGNVNIASLNIGNLNGGMEGMNGRIEDFRIYNRVLSPSEVSTLSANGADAISSTNVVTPVIILPPDNLLTHPPGQ